MKLKLTRPLATLDLETTGKNTQIDRIIEIAVVKLMPDGNTQTMHFVVNPGIAIPAEASEVHKFTDETVKDCPFFKEIAPLVIGFLDGCDLNGFNSNGYDLPMLVAECMRAGLTLDLSGRALLDCSVIFKRQEERTLTAAVKMYLDRDHAGAHGALADTLATLEVLKVQLERYKELPKDIHTLALYCNYDKKRVDLAGKFQLDENGKVIFAFGKYKDKNVKLYSAAVTDTQYLQYLLTQNNPPDFDSIVKGALDWALKLKSDRVEEQKEKAVDLFNANKE